jgi:hypothetical protein
LALVAAGCLVRDPTRCDDAHNDCAPGYTCDTKHYKCVPMDMGTVGGEDLSVGDLGMDLYAPSEGGMHPDLSRECDASTQCADPARPICGGSLCRACAAGDDNQCAEHAGVPYCEADAGRCVVCTPATEATSCPSPQPVCTTAGACRACMSDGECASKVCKPDGSCATANEVAYVDNAGIASYGCGSGMDAGVGSATDPFCEIQEGIDSGKPYVRVTGHAGAPYNSISITSAKTVTVVGPAVGDEPAIILASSGTANDVKVQVSSAATVTLIRVQIGSTSVGSTLDDVLCNGTGAVSPVSLSILSSSIFKSSGYGVNSTHCTLTLDSDRIAFNISGGVILSNVNKYSITNNYLYRNTGTAVQIDPTATGAFQLNTIVNNTATAGYAGVNCGSTAQPIEGTIFFNNKVTGSNMDQFGCNLLDCKVEIDPSFVDNNNDDYRFTNSTFVDVLPASLDGGAGAYPSHDIFGRHRPLGNGFDVGAYEKQ